MEDLELVESLSLAPLCTFLRRWSHLLHRVDSAVDATATILARPGVDPSWFTTSALDCPQLRYAEGWGCPEHHHPAQLRVLDHDGSVVAVAWWPDGTRLASASPDGTVRVWEPSGHSDPLVLTGHSGRREASVWSPDGS